MNCKAIGISINTNALGICGGTGFSIPAGEFDEGRPVRLNDWLPAEYRQYVKPIDITLADGKMTVESPYKNVSIPLGKNGHVSIDGIGLSYATCEISIYPE